MHIPNATTSPEQRFAASVRTGETYVVKRGARKLHDGRPTDLPAGTRVRVGESGGSYGTIVADADGDVLAFEVNADGTRKAGGEDGYVWAVDLVSEDDAQAVDVQALDLAAAFTALGITADAEKVLAVAQAIAEARA